MNNDIYDEEELQEMFEKGDIDPVTAGFMTGYLEA